MIRALAGERFWTVVFSSPGFTTLVVLIAGSSP